MHSLNGTRRRQFTRRLVRRLRGHIMETADLTHAVSILNSVIEIYRDIRQVQWKPTGPTDISDRKSVV